MTTTDELVACEVGPSRECSGAGTTETGLIRTRSSGSSTPYPAANSQEAVRPVCQQESSTRALLANRSHSQIKLRNGQRGNSRSRMKDVCELATRIGPGPVVNNEMSAQLRSLSTQLYYMLVMMLNDQDQEIVRNSRGHWFRSVAQVALGIRAGWYHIRSDTAIATETTIW